MGIYNQWKPRTVKQLRARRTVIVGILSEMSRDGWRHSKQFEYQPLERELAQIEATLKEKANAS